MRPVQAPTAGSREAAGSARIGNGDPRHVHHVATPITLVVHDVGGPVGLYWATRRPERVARLVIMNS